MRADKQARLLRALAAALSRDLAAPYQQLADEVGVSRRTLYRIAPNRDALFQRLRVEAVAATTAAVEAAIRFDGPFLRALGALTTEFVSNGALYAFWSADAPGRERQPGSDDGPPDNLHAYETGMYLFLERGRREGVLRADVPLAWLLASYDGLLLASAAFLRKREPWPGLDRMLLDSFLSGAGERGGPSLADSTDGAASVRGSHPAS